MDVPVLLTVSVPVPASAALMLAPGAVRSGFAVTRLPSGLVQGYAGPRDDEL